MKRLVRFLFWGGKGRGRACHLWSCWHDFSGLRLFRLAVVLVPLEHTQVFLGEKGGGRGMTFLVCLYFLQLCWRS